MVRQRPTRCLIEQHSSWVIDDHPDMRRHARQVIDAMASRFGNDEAVIGWQTDNEFSANLCYCPVCHAAFHQWLQKKYATLDVLNASWGTVFWSHEYTDWPQIPLPWEAKCGDVHNPSLQLDFRRFQSDATVSFQQEQIDLLRAKSPGRFITHNLMGLHGAPVVDGSIQLAPYGVGIYQALGVADALEADVEDTAFERV